VQDQVELGLMRGGHHEVARAYVLYRERRAQERARQVPKAVPAEPALHVTDNGQRVPLDFGKLQALVESACAGLGADVKAEPVLAETKRNLYDGVPIGEVHKAAILAARAQVPHGMRIECEVTNLVEVDQALAAGCDAILLDNMDDATVAQAVARIAGRAIVEVSGNVELARLPTLSTLGIDLVSVGALTHSVRAADVSLLFEVGG
jgi:hypothetical protein